MADLLDYLKWRGDLTFLQDAPNEVDALIFSALSYLNMEGIVSPSPSDPVSLSDAAQEFFALPDHMQRIRVKADLGLLSAAAESRRFGNTRLMFYRELLEEDTQFAAVTFCLEDGSAFLAFRGTDYSLVGWKEDFNMAFQPVIPAQALAVQYTLDFCKAHIMPIRLGGHSKGGNLAVFAASKSDPLLQQRILAVYNMDGPGFGEFLLNDPGYRAIVPRIRTYVPQSSVVGMLLEHEEPYQIVKSKQIGILQHETYSWEIMGKCFILKEEITEGSRFLNKAIKAWLESMTPAERNEVVDRLFDLLTTGNVDSALDIIQPKNIRNYLKTLKSDESIRKTLSTELASLIQAAWKTQFDSEEPKK